MPSILIADYEPDILDLLQTLLEDEGYTVLVTSTGETTLQMLYSQQQPLIVVLDFSIRTLSGRVIDTILHEPDLVNRHQYLLITGANLPDIKYMGRKFPLILKPFEISTLLHAITQLSSAEFSPCC